MNAIEERDFYGATATELVSRWDAGRSIWSLEMGGLGPGYEQCIQVAAVEMLRRVLDKPQMTVEQFEAAIDDPSHEISRKLGGMSGAQAGSAKWLAWKWYSIGPHALVMEAKKQGEGERLIQVSNDWPTLQGRPTT